MKKATTKKSKSTLKQPNKSPNKNTSKTKVKEVKDKFVDNITIDCDNSKTKKVNNKSSNNNTPTDTNIKSKFPEKFPFWARLKISKKRTTLVIDEEPAYNKKKKIMEDGFVHREAIHANDDCSNVKDCEEINPNPDVTDNRPMFLKRPRKLPKRLFEPHNKNLVMPEHLIERYDKNNKK